ncbi:MAG: hypothetical protein Q9225_006588 [Loekoesia sp. 1 TL-2023]
MSTTGRRGPTTRAASRAASSRAGSETASVADDAPADGRASRAGSAKDKRSVLGTRDIKTYGSKLAAAGAERMAAASTDLTVGGIEAALNDAQTETEGPTGQAQEQHLTPVREEPSEHSSDFYAGITSRERAQIIEQAVGEERSRIDQAIEAAGRANGNQPLEGTSVLQKQITLSSSNTSIDRPLSSFFQLRHYLAFAAFIMVLVLLFADIYRGPLLGGRFDLLKNRSSVGNHTVVTPLDIAALQQRLNTLEIQVQNRDKDSHMTHKQPPVNFFSPHNHPLVNPYLTSPTHLRTLRYADPETFYDVIQAFKKHVWPRTYTVSLTGKEALTVWGPWDEDSGPSWCAASGDGKLQLGSLVEGPMTPTELVVEYNPRSAELYPNLVPAPKEIELWMQVLDNDLRESIGRDVEAIYGDFELNPGSGSVVALPKDYVPVGRWVYDHHSPNHIQTLGIAIDLKGAQTKNLVVRVNSNWAMSPFACLYRLRLHGVSHLPDYRLQMA